MSKRVNVKAYKSFSVRNFIKNLQKIGYFLVQSGKGVSMALVKFKEKFAYHLHFFIH